MAAVLRAYSVWLVFFSFLGGGVWGVCHHIPEVLCSHIHTNSVGQSKHIPWEFIVVNYCMPKLSIIQYRLGSLALLMQAGLWQLGIVVIHEIWGWALLWRLAGALIYSAKKIGHKKKQTNNNALCSGCILLETGMGIWILQCRFQMSSWEVSVWAKPHYTKNLNVDCVQ